MRKNSKVLQLIFKLFQGLFGFKKKMDNIDETGVEFAKLMLIFVVEMDWIGN